MKNTKILEMLESGKIEELKKALQDEIYAESLKSKPGAKHRYTAMKKYFSYVNSSRECLQKPCVVEFEGKFVTSFTNSWSLVLTSEDTGELELFDKEKGNYPDVTRLLVFKGNRVKIYFDKVIAEAKSKGYRLNKNEVGPGFKYLMLYDGSYYKIGLIDATYGIINDGEPALTFKEEGPCKTLTIQNDIGVCLVMPVRIEGDPEEEGKVVIRVDA